MVFTASDCNGLKRLITPSSLGSEIFVPRGTTQSVISVGSIPTTLAIATQNPIMRSLTFFNEGPATILISIGTEANLANYTYKLPHHFILAGMIDGGDIWSAICQPGESALIRAAIAPSVKIP